MSSPETESHKVITLDGPAGSGKSTVGRILAEELHYCIVDSGAFYRSITHIALQELQENNLSMPELLKTQTFRQTIKNLKLNVTFQDNRQVITYQGDDMEFYIRHPAITDAIKEIADCAYIREKVNKMIRGLSARYSLVADGRDMGTVVFPDTPYKFYLDADLPTRAKRRFGEFEGRFPGITLAEIEKKIAQRDNDDMNRKFGGLKAASDAIFVDTTGRKIKAVVEILLAQIQQIESKIHQ